MRSLAAALEVSPATVAAADFAAAGIGGDVAVTGGALDAIERDLQTELRVGDRVVVEDPSWPRIADLVHALGLAVEPAAVDRHGLDPDRLGTALGRGARAVIATPRGQNPTGAWVDPARGRALRAVLAGHPDVLVVEDDSWPGWPTPRTSPCTRPAAAGPWSGRCPRSSAPTCGWPSSPATR